jgi:hypothetical protein
MSDAVLFEGSFYTRIMGHKTKVDFKIKNNYEVKSSFSSQGTLYEFNMKRWAKAGSDVAKALSPFNHFALLFDERFGGRNDEFGCVTVDIHPDGTEETVMLRSPRQITNMLKYATVNVFECAEQIMMQNRRCILDYAIVNLERGKQTTYEEYIHLVACHCLVHCLVHCPNVTFPLVDFCDDEQQFNESVLKGIEAAAVDDID